MSSRKRLSLRDWKLQQEIGVCNAQLHFMAQGNLDDGGPAAIAYWKGRREGLIAASRIHRHVPRKPF